MPKNSYSGNRVVSAHLHAVAAYVWAYSVGPAVCTGIPGGGTVLTLPDEPSDGDWYEWANPDNSASLANPITVEPSALAVAAGVTVQGAASLVLSTPGTSGRATFADRSNTWWIESAQYNARTPPGPTGFPPREDGFGPSVLTDIPVADGASAVMMTFPPIAAPIGAKLNVVGFVQVQNTVAAVRSATVALELASAPGSSIGHAPATELPANCSNMTIPFEGNLAPTTTPTTTLTINVYCLTAGASAGDLKAIQDGTQAFVTQVG